MSWADDYNAVVNSVPKENDVLRTIDGSPAKLTVEIKSGSPPFIYGRAFVPDVVDSPLGWFLQSDPDQHYGWKCILMPRARTKLIQRKGLNEIIEIKALKIIRQSQSGKALLCEVEEY